MKQEINCVMRGVAVVDSRQAVAAPVSGNGANSMDSTCVMLLLHDTPILACLTLALGPPLLRAFVAGALR